MRPKYIKVSVTSAGKTYETVKKDGKEIDKFLKEVKQKWEKKRLTFLAAKERQAEEEWSKNNKLIVNTVIIQNDK